MNASSNQMDFRFPLLSQHSDSLSRSLGCCLLPLESTSHISDVDAYPISLQLRTCRFMDNSPSPRLLPRARYDHSTSLRSLNGCPIQRHHVPLW
jgi:hypothetical protein